MYSITRSFRKIGLCTTRLTSVAESGAFQRRGCSLGAVTFPSDSPQHRVAQQLRIHQKHGGARGAGALLPQEHPLLGAMAGHHVAHLAHPVRNPALPVRDHPVRDSTLPPAGRRGSGPLGPEPWANDLDLIYII